MPRGASKHTPVISRGYQYPIGDILLVTTDDTDTTGTIVGTPEWSMWVEDATSFYFEDETGSYTAQKQHHRRGYFWYAYKRVGGKLHKLYLGMRENLTPATLESMAARFSAITAPKS